MSKFYSVKLGNAESEKVSQEQLDALKTRFGSRFHEFEVKEIKEPTKPADLTKDEAPAETKKSKKSE
jgi:hypothetical protein